MPYLFDTHALIYYAEGSNKLSTTAKDLIDSEEECLVSIASFWERGIKSSIGKLQFQPDFQTFILNEVNLVGYQILPIEIGHIFQLQQLPFHHRDPFDRIIISQALTESIPLVSADKMFDSYGVKRIW